MYASRHTSSYIYETKITWNRNWNNTLWLRGFMAHILDISVKSWNSCSLSLCSTETNQSNVCHIFTTVFIPFLFSITFDWGDISNTLKTVFDHMSEQLKVCLFASWCLQTWSIIAFRISCISYVLIICNKAMLLYRIWSAPGAVRNCWSQFLKL